ncbi:hypothetical protein IAD21_00533 [Abditibacteriota bacterium]|nr:hypothetical protein IAD21_00533 [Abditibacteriota bacterium]
MTNERVEAFGWEGDTTEPRIASATVEAGRITLQLKGSALEGASISFDARRLEFLASATDEQVAQLEVSAHGDGLDFPALNVYIAALGLVEVVTGLRSLKGNSSSAGATKSKAKGAAARANGAKGGRPKGAKNKTKV